MGFRLQELQRLFFDRGPRPGLGALLEAVRLKRQTLQRERERLAHQDRLLRDCEAMLLSEGWNPCARSSSARLDSAPWGQAQTALMKNPRAKRILLIQAHPRSDCFCAALGPYSTGSAV